MTRVTESDLMSHDAYQELVQKLLQHKDGAGSRGGYFSPPSRPQLLEKLEHLSRYSHLVLVLTGVSGVGKSTLLKAFYPSPQDDSVHACCISPSGALGLGDLLAELVQQLELDLLPTASDEDKLEALYRHAELLRDISRQFLIVVDDAERLSVDALDLLINLLSQTRDPDARPHLVLFGSPRLNELLDGARFRSLHQGGGHQVVLEPFTYEDTREYLRFRLKDNFSTLSPARIQQIYHASFGLPGRINKLMSGQGDASAVRRGSFSIGWPGLRLPRLHRWLLFGVLGVTGMGVLLSTLWEGAAQETASTVSLTLPLAGRLESPSDEEAVAPVLTLAEKLAREERRLALEASGRSMPVESTSAAEGDAALSVAPLRAPQQPAPVAAPVEVATEAGELVLEPPPPPPALPVAAAPRSAGSPPSVQSLAPGVVSRTLHPLRRDQELLSWGAKDYTLQMLGARHAESAVEFIQEQRRPQEFYYFATLYKGKPWHVVVYGRYASREEALAAVPRLPAALRRLKPWARSVAGVQNDIRRQE